MIPFSPLSQRAGIDPTCRAQKHPEAHYFASAKCSVLLLSEKGAVGGVRKAPYHNRETRLTTRSSEQTFIYRAT